MPQPRQTDAPAHNAGIDALRIIAMLMIVAGHYAMHGVGQDALAAMAPSAQRTLLHLLLLIGIPGIDCFVLISGYFLIRAHWSVRKPLRLLGQVYFYLLLIFALAKLTGFAPINAQNTFYHRIFWFASSSYLAWFAAAYLLLYALVPFVNACLLHLTQRRHAALIALCCAVWGALPTFFGEDYLYTNTKLTLFLTVYIIGAYIRLYPCPLFAKCGRNFALAALFFGINAARVVLFDVRGAAGADAWDYVFRIKDAAQLPVLGFAVFLFLACKNLPLRPARWRKALAGATFGVYLIHDDAILSPVLWGALGAQKAAQGGFWPLLAHVLLCTAGIFLVCAGIELLRQALTRAASRLCAAPLAALRARALPLGRALGAPFFALWRLLNR